MLERSFDTARINEVINHPSVRPYVGPGDSFADVTPLVEDTDNWFLIGEHGGFGLTQTTPGVHEIHTFILPEGRGAWARDAARPPRRRPPATAPPLAARHAPAV